MIPCQGPNSTKKPFVIPYADLDKTKAPLTVQKLSKSMLVIKGPSPTPYESEKKLPWSYDATIYMNGQKQEHAITNIVGTWGITRSGRIYTPY